MSDRLRYRPEIDGLRAFAILPVVAYHLNPSWIPGGFVGVDIFFVISGYLITQIILREHENHAFTLTGFWARRVRRIMPALVTVLLCTLIASLVISFPDTWKTAGLQAASVLSLVANVAMWKLTGSYWGPTADTLCLLHTWSLSVEEQFYLFYPLLLLPILRLKPLPMAKIWTALALGFLLCVYGTYRSPAAAFFLLPTRAWELGFGCVMALTGTPRQPSHGLTAVGLALILFSIFVIDGSMRFPGAWSFLPVFGTGLVLRSADGLLPRRGSTLSLLQNRILVYIGKISYSLYLWHWAVIVLGREWQTRTESGSRLYLALIPLLAMASYHLVEQPGRHSKRAVYFFVGAGCVAAGTLCLYLALLPLPGAPPEFKATRWFGNEYDVTPRSQVLEGATRIRMAGIERVERGRIDSAILRTGGHLKTYGGATPAVVVFGSSHALMWASVIDRVCKDLHATVSFQTANAVAGYVPVPPGSEKALFLTPEEKLAFDTGRLESLRRWRPKVLVIADMYSLPDIPNYRPLLSDPALANTEVVFLEQPPWLAIGDVNAPRYVAWQQTGTQEDVSLMPVMDTSKTRTALENLAREWSNVRILPTQDLFLRDGRALARVADEVLYVDDDHLSEAGAQRLRPRLQALLKEVLERLPSPSEDRAPAS